MITCVIGSGGKTTLIHQLAMGYQKENKKVFISTTTHMKIEPDTLVTEDADEIIQALNENGFCFAGAPCQEAGKLSALPEAVLQKVIPYADEVLIEADGSKRLPLKFPNSTEPVLVPGCKRIIVVSSLLALKKPAKEVVHRLELALPVLNIKEDTPILETHIQTLLREGYLRPLMNQGYKPEIKITHDNSLYQRALAALIQADMDVSVLDPNWFKEKPRLFICGAGHVAKELADIASYLDFRIAVMDKRSEFANKERFPQAEEVICASFDELPEHLEDDTYYAVATPGHQDDYTCVKHILKSNYSYLGMIGSIKKVATTRERLLADGYTQEIIDTMHAPIGLAIGAVTPGEIAISILAQIIEIKNKKAGSSACAEILQSQENGVLCIIIDKTGSAPRGVGSMMLVTEHGQIDTLGGGAIENQVIRDAKGVTTPAIKEYNLGPSDVAKLGMICGGKNRVLFIPLPRI